MRTNPLIPLASALAIAICAFALIAGGQSTPPAVQSNSPLTVARTVILAEEFLQGTTVQLRAQYVKAVRENGSWVEVRSSLAPGGTREHRQQRIVHFSDGRKIIFQDALRTRTTFFRSVEAQRGFFAARLRSPESGCMRSLDGVDAAKGGEAVIGSEQIGGLMAVHTRATHGPTIDLWYAPDLGCEIIQQIVTLEGGQQSRQALVSYRAGEADATLFSETEGYEEVTPSEAAARLFEKMNGKRPDALNDSGVMRLEEEYRAGRNTQRPTR